MMPAGETAPVVSFAVAMIATPDSAYKLPFASSLNVVLVCVAVVP
jgi:hypothetical protein